MDKIFSLRGIFNSPSHIFIIPNIDSNPPITKISKIKNFHDLKTHVSQLDSLLNDVIAKIENEYDEHPLHYNKKVEFRTAIYIDNRQEFSFWPAEKPFAEYPLTKPSFDKVIEKLNLTNDNYHIVIDLVTDWEDQISSFNSPPKSYGIEVAVLFNNNNQIPNMRISMNEEQLDLCKLNHELLDTNLAPIFEKISVNIPNWYEPMKNNNKPKM